MEKKWVIKTLDSQGTIFRKNGKILFFDSPTDARAFINTCVDSSYLMVKPFVSKNKHRDLRT